MVGMNPGDTRTLTKAITTRTRSQTLVAPKWGVVELDERLPANAYCKEAWMWVITYEGVAMRVGESRLERQSEPGIVERPKCKCGNPLTGKQKLYCSPKCGDYYAGKYRPAVAQPTDGYSVTCWPIIRGGTLRYTLGPPIAGVY